MGHTVTAFDIHTNLGGCIDGRADADKRIDRHAISFAQGDGHAMPFENASFGHLLCYDTLHHMHDYDQVFREFARVLEPGGRAIFVEPGAKHGSSPETLAFLELKKDDPTWIERDVVLEEINRCATNAGLSELSIMPSIHPLAPAIYPVSAWLNFRNGDKPLRADFLDRLIDLNYNQRVVFYADKPA